jgi:hypothetical protein
MGVALSQIYGKAWPDAKSSVQATKASAENLNLLQAVRGEVAFTLGDTLSDAWKGNEEAGFKTPLKKLRGIAIGRPGCGVAARFGDLGKDLVVAVPADVVAKVRDAAYQAVDREHDRAVCGRCGVGALIRGFACWCNF